VLPTNLHDALQVERGGEQSQTSWGGSLVSKIVLCVDDSATMQQVADITFRGTEFMYVGARSFDEGMDKARAQKPIVILADSHMPGKSGYDLCLALKTDPATSNIPVAILVGNAAPYDAARGVQVGADANLPKPWDTQTMLEKVTEIVSKAATGVVKPGQAAAAAGSPAAGPAAGAAPGAPSTGPLAASAKGAGAAATVPPAAAAAVPPGAAAAAASAAMPPRSATIMGMPTIKMPAGNAQPAPPAAPPAAPAGPTRTSVMAVPPISPTSGPGTSPSIRSPAPPPPAPVVAAAASAVNRAPMVSGTPTKRSLLVERTLAKMAARLAEASGLEPGSPELTALLKLSAEVVERIVWEIVPDLAEQIIRENLHDLTARRS
jgi:CheY-like chemotaxis protein